MKNVTVRFGPGVIAVGVVAALAWCVTKITTTVISRKETSRILEWADNACEKWMKKMAELMEDY
jgi:pantoate kinase